MKSKANLKISVETALLIATANARGIDLSVWFNERFNNGKLKLDDFNEKLTGLATTMGIDQDEETKEELLVAVSPASLGTIQRICGVADESRLTAFIDVTLFLRLALKMGDDLLNGVETEEFPTLTEGSYSFADMMMADAIIKEKQLASASVENKEDLMPFDPSLGQVSHTDDLVLTASDYISGMTPSRVAPKDTSASSGKQQPLSIQSPSGGGVGESVRVPFSPYDEEVAFDPNDEEDVDSNYLNNKRGRGRNAPRSAGKPANATAAAATTENVDWDLENRKFLARSNDFDLGGGVKRSSSAGPARGRVSSAGPQNAQSQDFAHAAGRAVQHPTLSHSVGVTDLRGRSASAGRIRRNSFNGLNQQQQHRGVSPHNPNSVSTMSRGGKSSVAKLNDMKDLVEDMVRSAVKKTDLYHLMQVHLGFIEDYTMVPPRGAIVVTRRREYLTNRELQIAFLAGRLCLTDPQLAVLRSLVVTFSKQFDSLYASKAEIVEIKTDNYLTASQQQEAIKVVDEVAELRAKPVLSVNHCLSSDWLKRYLLHLRLTKKTASSSANTEDAVPAQERGRGIRISTAASGTGEQVQISPTNGGGANNNKSPVLWKEWLGTKLKEEVDRAPLKPKEFEKALEGNAHTLCKEDLEKLLKQYKILPSERLHQEIELRIKSWLMDIDGRRDFQHHLNVKIRNWIWNEWKKKGSDKCPKNEQGYRNIFDQLPDEQKKSIRSKLTEELTAQKRQELLTSERTKCEITKDLYWKFDTARKELPISWNNWLEKHIQSFESTLKKFKQDDQRRQAYVNRIKDQRRTVAGLNDVETQLNKVSKSDLLDAHHQMQLQKGIVALRKVAENKGLAKGTVITKEDFDTHIKRVLIPCIKLDATGSNKIVNADDGASSAVTPVNPQEQKMIEDITNLFHNDIGEAVGRVLDVEKAKSGENKACYEEWLQKKREQREKAAAEKLKAEEEAKKAKEAKDRKAKKVYEKWLKMSLKNKYKSRIDKKYHDIPPPKKIVHQNKFRVEKDLQAVYAEQEKTY